MHRRQDLTYAQLIALVKAGDLTIGGNRGSTRADWIYGTLERVEVDGQLVTRCPGGRTIRTTADHPKSNQVFFTDEAEALELGYRPCAKCLPTLYAGWKAATDQAGWAQARLATLRSTLRSPR